jgi:transposase
VRESEAPSKVVASYGFSRTTICKWINAAAKPGVGLKALRSRPASGRPRRLKQQVFSWIDQ